MYIAILYIAIKSYQVCIDYGNLTWANPSVRKVLKQAISFYTEEGAVMELWNYMLWHMPLSIIMCSLHCLISSS